MVERDKLWHFVASFGLVVVAFGFLTAVPCSRKRLSFNYRLLFSTLFSLTLGFAKEISDALFDNMPWCKPSCHFDGWDIFINIDSILAAVCFIVLVKVFFFRKGRDNDEQTVAMTQDGDELEQCSENDGDSKQYSTEKASSPSSSQCSSDSIPAEIHATTSFEDMDELGDEEVQSNPYSEAL